MTDTENKSCGTACKFDYCFWSKMIVAIPAIPLLSIFTAHFFTDIAWQFAIASYTGAVVVLVAQKIDRLPSLSKKVVPGKE